MQVTFLSLSFSLESIWCQYVSSSTCSPTHLQWYSTKQVRRGRRSCCYKLSSRFRTSYPSPLINCKRSAWTSSKASQICVIASGRLDWIMSHFRFQLVRFTKTGTSKNEGYWGNISTKGDTTRCWVWAIALHSYLPGNSQLN